MTTQLEYFRKAIAKLNDDGNLTEEKVIEAFKITNPYHGQVIELSDEYRLILLSKLTKIVNDFYGLSVKGIRRNNTNCRARKVLIYTALEMQIVSGMRLARHLNKDHSTISTAYYKAVSDITPINGRYMPDEKLYEEIKEIQKRFQHAMV